MSLPSPHGESPAALSFREISFAYSFSTTVTRADPASAVKTEFHASARPNHVRVNCSAVFIDKANLLAEHIGHRLGVG